MPLIEELPLTAPTRITPGWALVPETQPITALAPGKRSRGAGARDGGHGGRTSGISAKQAKAAEARLASLEKENHHDVTIPLPAAARSRERRTKMTSNVRRILMYQRNFQHYLADELASAQAAGGGGIMATAVAVSTQGGGGRRKESGIAGAAKAGSKRTSAQQQQQLPMHPLPRPRSSNAAQTSTPVKREPSSSAPGMPPASSAQNTTADPTDPLLKPLNIPQPPTARVMALLLAEPPLSYNAARATVSDSDHAAQKSTRHFCGNCGYWGKLRCRACGSGRTCGLLECYRAHRQVCEGLLR